MTEEYDYVVVGAGAAGSVVANRLSATGASVLVLEAGGTRIPAAVDDAGLWFTLFGSDVDWGYHSVPQPGLDGRSTYEPRGRLAGGSSNLYIMMHVRGAAADFDNWAYGGAAGWSWADVRPWFDRLEDDQDSGGPRGGPQTITHADRHGPNPYSVAFLDACQELGLPPAGDVTAGTLDGAGWHRLNVRDGRRRSALDCYLEPAVHDGLHLRTEALVTGLMLEGDRCVGVRYEHHPARSVAPGRDLAGPHLSVAERGPQEVRARAEVILCAGAIESPKLLMLSGIGDPDELAEHGIQAQVPLPGVGRNFHNHVLTGVIAETREPVPAARQNLSEAVLFLGSRPGLPAPDLQMAFVHAPFDIIVGQQHPNAVTILPGVVRPVSRGWVRLASADPSAAPLVNPNYLADPSDVDRLVQGVRLARELYGTAVFSKLLKDEVFPGTDVTSDADLRAFVRRSADSYHHQVGSCRMGTDGLAVVDPRLAVRGLRGLRVADASVMPAVTSGNTHAVVEMIAERCVGFLEEDAGD